MLLVTYDFSSDKTRTKFSKFLEKYGYRIQYSVFKIKNSKRILNNIKAEIDKKFSKHFKNTDSIYIFSVCEGCDKRLYKYGYAKHEDDEVVYF